MILLPTPVVGLLRVAFSGIPGLADRTKHFECREVARRRLAGSLHGFCLLSLACVGHADPSLAWRPERILPPFTANRRLRGVSGP